MKEPRIQYVKTSDGVSIAYWTLGEGTPLVFMPYLVMSNIRMEWQRPRRRSFYERLAKRCKVIRYDCRGAGLSDRSVADYSLGGLVLDIEAVVDGLGLESFALFAPARSGPAAITYAADHPARVSRLLLWCSSPRCADLTPAASTTREHALRTLREQDWELYTETIALLRYGWSQAEDAQQVAEMMREGTTPENMQAFDDSLADVDVTGRLHEVKARTLVMHQRKHRYLSFDVARRLAGGISNAQLALLEGESGTIYSEDVDEVLRVIDEFLGESEAQAASDLPSGTAVILFADIVDSTALTERLGDAAFRRKARELGPSLRAVIRGQAGRR